MCMQLGICCGEPQQLVVLCSIQHNAMARPNVVYQLRCITAGTAVMWLGVLLLLLLLLLRLHMKQYRGREPGHSTARADPHT